MKTFLRYALLAVTVFILGGCTDDYQNVPPNDIGMMLTPTGYEGKVYTPGQVNVGTKDVSGAYNRLVLIQRSAIEVKEQFLDAAANEDKTDHRCLLGDKTAAALDVRLVMAIPNHETPEGLKDLSRLFLLGNPKAVEGTGDRVLRLSAESVYGEQARQQVRGKIRQICASYKDFDALFTAYSHPGPDGLVEQMEHTIAEILKEKKVPLGLVNAFPSNLKPDPQIMAAIAQLQAAQKRTEAIKAITDFLDADRTGSRRFVYQIQATQEIVNTANTNGHNTIILGFGANGGGAGSPTIMPMPKETVIVKQAPPAPPADPPQKK